MSIYMATLEADDGSLLGEPLFDYVRHNLKKAVAEEWKGKAGDIVIWYCVCEETYKDTDELKEHSGIK